MNRGEAVHCAKLTEADVIAIREDAATACPCCGVVPTGGMLARRYGVSRQMISNIVRGYNWKHVGEPA